MMKPEPAFTRICGAAAAALAFSLPRALAIAGSGVPPIAARAVMLTTVGSSVRTSCAWLNDICCARAGRAGTAMTRAAASTIMPARTVNLRIDRSPLLRRRRTLATRPSRWNYGVACDRMRPGPTFGA